MTDLTIATVLAWLLVAFFTVGGIVNWIAPGKIRADYARWGYPGWFHYLTAVLELGVAGLLAFPDTRWQGAVLGVAVMVAAAGTLLHHREYTHAIAPVAVLLLTAWCGWLA